MDPQSAKQLFAHASECRANGKLLEALDALHRLYCAYPGEKEVVRSLAEVRLQLNHYSEAMQIAMYLAKRWKDKRGESLEAEIAHKAKKVTVRRTFAMAGKSLVRAGVLFFILSFTPLFRIFYGAGQWDAKAMRVLCIIWMAIGVIILMLEKVSRPSIPPHCEALHEELVSTLNSSLYL